MVHNKLEFIENIKRKLCNYERLDGNEITAIISALREANNCLQVPYYELVYHDKYDNTERRIVDPTYANTRTVIDVCGDMCIHEDCFYIRFGRFEKSEDK